DTEVGRAILDIRRDVVGLEEQEIDRLVAERGAADESAAVLAERVAEPDPGSGEEIAHRSERPPLREGDRDRPLRHAQDSAPLTRSTAAPRPASFCSICS